MDTEKIENKFCDRSIMIELSWRELSQITLIKKSLKKRFKNFDVIDEDLALLQRVLALKLHCYIKCCFVF